MNRCITFEAKNFENELINAGITFDQFQNIRKIWHELTSAGQAEVDDMLKGMKKENAIKNDWIPVSSGLYPEDDEIVQVTYIGHNSGKPHCNAFAYIDDGVWHWSLDSDIVKVKITAWRYNDDAYRES